MGTGRGIEAAQRWQEANWVLALRAQTQGTKALSIGAQNQRGNKSHPDIFPPGHLSYPGNFQPGHLSTRAKRPQANVGASTEVPYCHFYDVTLEQFQNTDQRSGG